MEQMVLQYFIYERIVFFFWLLSSRAANKNCVEIGGKGCMYTKDWYLYTKDWYA
jgi:hypothetical protein